MGLSTSYNEFMEELKRVLVSRANGGCLRELLVKVGDVTQIHEYGLFHILDVSLERMEVTPVQKIVSPQLRMPMDKIKSYILGLQQRAELSQSFGGMGWR